MCIFELMYNHNYLKQKRKDLRNKATSAEAFLWRHLSNKQLEGRKFRKQQSLQNYIVDFYCPSEKLIIELDGAYHSEPLMIERDEIRDKKLQDLGFTILRFENKLVFDDLNGVLNTIVENFEQGRSFPPFEGGDRGGSIPP